MVGSLGNCTYLPISKLPYANIESLCSGVICRNGDVTCERPESNNTYKVSVY